MTKQQPPVLRTALKRPAPPEDLVLRPRLQDLLGEHAHRDFTLVSAPAGSGKSTLVSSWLDGCGLPSGWLSVDEQDDEPRRFLACLIAAVRSIDKLSCRDSETLLEGATLPSAPVLASYLSNDLEEIGEPFVLVIDDYHRIHDRTIHAVVRHLVEHPPRPLHLILITRRDPPLPMAGLRTRSSVVEIRERDLRFNLEETRAAIQNMAGVSVADETLAGLHAELEGWIVGLRLVCLALRHQADPDDYLRTVHGHGGSAGIQQYLLEEVLRRQSPELRSCLLKISILDRFCPDVVEALCAPASSTESPAIKGDDRVHLMRQSNLFVIDLDEQGQWFRFHHLFQQLLQRRLRKETSAEDVATLRLQASEWFESRGLTTESIHYALAAGDNERAAALVERHRRDELNADRWHVVEQWMARLPEEVRLRAPGLPLTQAWIAHWRYQLARIGPFVEQAASLIDEKNADPSILGELDFFRGHLAYWRGDPEIATELAERAQSRLAGVGGVIEGRVEITLGWARCMGGRHKMAAEALEHRIRTVDPADDALLSQLLGALILVHFTSGDLIASALIAERLYALTKKVRMGNSSAWACYFLGYMHFHSLDLGGAVERFREALRQPYILEGRGVLDTFVGLAIAQQLAGNTESAEQTMGRLMSYVRESSVTEFQSVARSCRARLSVLQGDASSAGRWAESPIAAPGVPDLFTWLENPSITQARALIAVGSEPDLRKAAELLRTVRDRSEEWHLKGQTIEVAVLQSLALAKQGRNDEALAVLEEAVDLATPGGWIRPFVEAGPPMDTLLARLPRTVQDRRFVEQLRLAVSENSDALPGIPGGDAPMIEALTNREYDVLELLAKRLYDKEIGTALSISVGTVKTHLKHIYGKLEASNRREAVGKAKKLGLLK